MSWKQPIDTNILVEFEHDPLAGLLYRELIMRSANRDGFFTLKNKISIKIKRGQVVFGRKAFHRYLAREEKDDGKKVERCLHKLCDFYQKVTLEVTPNKYTIVNLIKYEELNSLDPVLDPPMTHRRPTDDPPMTTSKILKSVKTINNKDIEPPNSPPSGDILEKKEIALSPAVREVWEYWETEMAPITRNQIFHRNVLSGLLKQHGCDTVKKMIRVAAAAHVEKYTSKNLKVTSPKQLEQQWDALVLFAKSKITTQQANHFTTK